MLNSHCPIQHLQNALFECSAPAVWNLLPKTVLSSDSVAVFKSKQKQIPLLPGFLFFLCSRTRCLAPAPLESRSYGAIQICLFIVIIINQRQAEVVDSGHEHSSAFWRSQSNDSTATAVTVDRCEK